MFIVRFLILIALALSACSKTPDPATMSVMVFQIIENSKGEIKHSSRDDLAFLYQYSRLIGKYNTLNGRQLDELKWTLLVRDAIWQLKAMCDSNLTTDNDGTPQEVALAILRAKEVGIPLAEIVLYGGFNPTELVVIMEGKTKKNLMAQSGGPGANPTDEMFFKDIELLKEIAAVYALRPSELPPAEDANSPTATPF